MFEQQPAALQQHVKTLATQAQQQNQPYAWFEPLYAQAQGDMAQVPWAKSTPHPYLQEWLLQQSQVSNRSALVIGCGLGDDAEALQSHGYQVTAFDVSPTAIAWCRQRFPNSEVHYQAADLFNLDPNWQQTFDLVYECRNIQALPIGMRPQVIGAIAPLVSQTGMLLVITRTRTDETECEGPPWPLSPQELAEFTTYGFQETERAIFLAGGTVPQARIIYHRMNTGI
ncbi:methyltransferase domain-containing protein [Acaryochloris sp. IP29b_bin.148]|uniref:class I SAM-dependent methyltransferase n=1 Tax=Acaryochloris sp. IP29b_bin.148 TaxID=2969218 RepID=UPI0034515253